MRAGCCLWTYRMNGLVECVTVCLKSVVILILVPALFRQMKEISLWTPLFHTVRWMAAQSWISMEICNIKGKRHAPKKKKIVVEICITHTLMKIFIDLNIAFLCIRDFHRILKGCMKNLIWSAFLTWQLLGYLTFLSCYL